MKKLIVPVVLLIVIVASCSKDQKVVNELEGTWDITRQSINGVVVGGNDGTTYTFEKCKVKKGDCPGTLSALDSLKGNIATPFTYSISEKGTKISITYNFFGFETSINGDILEHTKTKFTYEYIQIGDVYEETLEKQ